MKRLILVLIFLYSSALIFSQTWVVDGGNDWNIEYTVINQDNFERILKANEVTAESALLFFTDKQEMENARVIRGTKPKFNGFYFLSVKRIPKSEGARLVMAFFRSIIVYGNSETGAMSISFLVTSSAPGVINLKTNKSEYENSYNSYVKQVNGDYE